MSTRGGRFAGDMRPTVSIGRKILRKFVSATDASELGSAGEKNRHDEVTSPRGGNCRSDSVIDNDRSTDSIGRIWRQGGNSRYLPLRDLNVWRCSDERRRDNGSAGRRIYRVPDFHGQRTDARFGTR